MVRPLPPTSVRPPPVLRPAFRGIVFGAHVDAAAEAAAKTSGCARRRRGRSAEEMMEEWTGAGEGGGEGADATPREDDDVKNNIFGRATTSGERRRPCSRGLCVCASFSIHKRRGEMPPPLRRQAMQLHASSYQSWCHLSASEFHPRTNGWTWLIPLSFLFCHGQSNQDVFFPDCVGKFFAFSSPFHGTNDIGVAPSFLLIPFPSNDTQPPPSFPLRVLEETVKIYSDGRVPQLAFLQSRSLSLSHMCRYSKTNRTPTDAGTGTER